MSTELAPHPTAFFDEHGHMREAKSKAVLKTSSKVEVSGRGVENSVQARFLDGCAVLWVIPWPVNGKVQDFLDAFRKYVHSHLRRCDVYLVFDRYCITYMCLSTYIFTSLCRSMYKLTESTHYQISDIYHVAI